MEEMQSVVLEKPCLDFCETASAHAPFGYLSWLQVIRFTELIDAVCFIEKLNMCENANFAFDGSILANKFQEQPLWLSDSSYKNRIPNFQQEGIFLKCQNGRKCPSEASLVQLNIDGWKSASGLQEN